MYKSCKEHSKNRKATTFDNLQYSLSVKETKKKTYKIAKAK